MKRYRWQIITGFLLIGMSCLIYIIHYMIFQDMHHILIFLAGDFAFLPFEVLIVTLIIDQLLKAREKKTMLNKLNMTIGIFFSKMGIALLRSTSSFDRNSAGKGDRFVFTNDWDMKAFEKIAASIEDITYDIDSRYGNLQDLKNLLSGEKDFLLLLLGNPNLLEHEKFTNLLWAVTHLLEELVLRPDLSKLSEADLSHISGDIRRVYLLLLAEWFTYMGHLKSHYPYLFSLAVRTNPFDTKASVEF